MARHGPAHACEPDDLQPEPFQLLQADDKVSEGARLGEVGVGVQLVAAKTVGFLGRRPQHDHGDAPDFLEHLATILLRQFDVEENELDRERVDMCSPYVGGTE